MKVLITGSTGFVGQNLMPKLIENFPDIDILTLNVNVEKAQNKYPYKQCKHVNTTDMDEVVKFNPEIVIHLATISSARNDTDIIKPMIAANIEFGVLLFDTLQRCSSLKLFVNTGSFAEYRYGPNEINDAYLYATTKSSFRLFCDYYSQLGGFKYITVVPYTIYGGKPTVKRLMDYILESMDSKVPVDMTAGEQILDFTHVNDLVKFYLYIIEERTLFYNLRNSEEFHIGTGKGTSIKELVLIIEKVYGKECNINFGGRPYRDRDIMYAVAPIAKNISLVNWKAKIGIEEGLRMMKSDIIKF